MRERLTMLAVAVCASLAAFGGARASAAPADHPPPGIPLPPSVATLSPVLPLPAGLPPFPYPADVPVVELPADIPPVPLPSAIPEVRLPADVPTVEMPADVPPIALPAEIPRGLL
jgi:hypothetical protein